MRRFLFALVLTVAPLSACSTSQKAYTHLTLGMPKMGIMKAMGGCPDRTLTSGAYQALTYNDRMLTFFQPRTSNYSFILKDGRLIDFGEGAVHEAGTRDAPTLVVDHPQPSALKKTAETETLSATETDCG